MREIKIHYLSHQYALRLLVILQQFQYSDLIFLCHVFASRSAWWTSCLSAVSFLGSCVSAALLEGGGSYARNSTRVQTPQAAKSGEIIAGGFVKALQTELRLLPRNGPL